MSVDKDSSRSRLLWAATSCGVIALAGGGFTLSFASLRDLAIASDVPTGLAFIWPLIVDGFIVVATAAAFALKSRRGLAWYPWTALVAFSAISVTGNALHAADTINQLRVPLLLASVVSAVPAVALLVASHLLVVMADSRTRTVTTVQRATEESHTRGRAPAIPTVGMDEALLEPMTAVSTASQALPATSPVGDTELLARVVEVVAGGAKVTGADVARWLGVSARTGRRRLDELRALHPELFNDAPSAPAPTRARSQVPA
ncbi:DUF2637 domain-containing protein [Leifsonia sp. NPDC102414]|uniref:DUF2637 domain-containing protein n=1 Tax=Leifsonia sp. NPDC102414 TaxID=3364124 RepID=UPI00382073CB